MYKAKEAGVWGAGQNRQGPSYKAIHAEVNGCVRDPQQPPQHCTVTITEEITLMENESVHGETLNLYTSVVAIGIHQSHRARTTSQDKDTLGHFCLIRWFLTGVVVLPNVNVRVKSYNFRTFSVQLSWIKQWCFRKTSSYEDSVKVLVVYRMWIFIHITI